VRVGTSVAITFAVEAVPADDKKLHLCSTGDSLPHLPLSTTVRTRMGRKPTKSALQSRTKAQDQAEKSLV
jgi:hypothetical protein